MLDTRVISLQVNRPGTRQIGPQRAAGATHDRLIIDDSLAVKYHRDMPGRFQPLQSKRTGKRLLEYHESV